MKFKTPTDTFAIHKYTLPINDRVEIQLPVGAKILTVQMQDEIPRIWALVDRNEKLTKTHVFYFLGTGYEHLTSLLEDLEYITTVQMIEGSYVWHIFKRIEKGEKEQ